ncbi:glycosyl hydrolase family 17 [bacterium]|nr:glycosyl hydrolase family 17 [bacterium]
MIFNQFRTLFLLLGLICLASCQYHKNIEASDDTGRESIQTEHGDTLMAQLERESPFTKRLFKPYLDDLWIGKAVSYGCYREGQAPGVIGPSTMEILEDLTLLSQYWNLIRVYGSDADNERVLEVIHDNQLPLRLVLGIWLENETKNPERKLENLKQLNKAIELASRFPDEVIAINVGNESQVDWSWHRMEAAVLVNYIRAVRQNTQVPVTTADDYNFWNKPESQQIADEIDFIVLHAHALWNGQQLDHAVQWTDSVYQDIKLKHPDKTVVLGETGWATDYNPEKTGPGEQGSLIKGEVSVAAQGKFLIDLNRWIDEKQITTFIFEAFDEPWKGGGESSGPLEVEKHWGVFYKDRSPKASFSNYLDNISRSTK